MPTGPRLLVTGSRYGGNRALHALGLGIGYGLAVSEFEARWRHRRRYWGQSAEDVAEDLGPRDAPVTLIHGGAPGLDAAAAAYWQGILKMPFEVYPADWSIGPSAGPQRNQRMVETGADACVAFPDDDSRGTWDCVRRAQSRAIKTVVVHMDGTIRRTWLG